MIVKRIIVFAMLAVGMFLVMRKIAEIVGPAVRERCSRMCDRMLATCPNGEKQPKNSGGAEDPG